MISVQSFRQKKIKRGQWWCNYCSIWTSFIQCPSIFIVDFEPTNSSWEAFWKYFRLIKSSFVTNTSKIFWPHEIQHFFLTTPCVNFRIVGDFFHRNHCTQTFTIVPGLWTWTLGYNSIVGNQNKKTCFVESSSKLLKKFMKPLCRHRSQSSSSFQNWILASIVIKPWEKILDKQSLKITKLKKRRSYIGT